MRLTWHWLSHSSTVNALARAGVALALACTAAHAASTPAGSNPTRTGQLVTRGPDSARRIALTFDDGPGPDTDKFVELLARHQVRATFFVLGQYAERRPGTLKQLAAHRHEIGSHTYGHTNYLQQSKRVAGGSDRARKDLLEDLRRTQAIIQKETGAPVTLCRMPYGVDRPWIRDAARAMNYTLVNWSYGADWNSGTAKTLLPGYLSAIRPGAILLLHDGGSNRSITLSLAESIIRSAREQGYELVTVSELLAATPTPGGNRPPVNTAATR